MLVVRYKPSFVRDFKKLPIDLQNDAKEKIDLFKAESTHQKLKVHKLKGKLKDFHSFSVTYSHRVVFQYEAIDEVVFLAIGTHNVYR